MYYSKEILTGKCDVCKEREAVIKCSNCFLDHLCFLCDEIVHNIETHDRSSFVDGYFQPLLVIEALNESLQVESSGKSCLFQILKQSKGGLLYLQTCSRFVSLVH